MKTLYIVPNDLLERCKQGQSKIKTANHDEKLMKDNQDRVKQ